MDFKALYIMEHVVGEPQKFDTQIIVIYDPVDRTFFYYGTRQSNLADAYVTYKGEFHCSRMNSFVTFLTNILNNLDEIVSVELHDVRISESEYNTLNYYRMKEKISRRTEMWAYDRIRVNKTEVFNMLDMLVSNDVDSPDVNFTHDSY